VTRKLYKNEWHEQDSNLPRRRNNRGEERQSVYFAASPDRARRSPNVAGVLGNRRIFLSRYCLQREGLHKIASDQFKVQQTGNLDTGRNKGRSSFQGSS
jgi:hypothetical protein